MKFTTWLDKNTDWEMTNREDTEVYFIDAKDTDDGEPDIVAILENGNMVVTDVLNNFQTDKSTSFDFQTGQRALRSHIKSVLNRL